MFLRFEGKTPKGKAPVKLITSKTSENTNNFYAPATDGIYWIFL